MIKIKDAVRIYKNSKMFENTIMLELKSSGVNRVETEGVISKLFHNDVLVGVNVFDHDLSSKFEEGFTYPEASIIEILNDYFDDLEFHFDKHEALRVGKVLSLESVENSDKLHLCEVETSLGVHSIVCGAANVYEGMKTVVALDNALLPTGVRINEGPVFKVHSDGMLCSKRELGLEQLDSEPGIVDLDTSESLDQSFFDIDWRKSNV